MKNMDPKNSGYPVVEKHRQHQYREHNPEEDTKGNKPGDK